jgi:predicted MFS family arabinose efflux permease
MEFPRSSVTKVPGLLRNRNFTLLWVGAVASASGFYVGNVVIEWLIYSSGHQPIDLTILGIVEFIPTLTIGVLAGALADRYDRRHLMIVADLARAATMAGLAIYVLTRGYDLPVILVAVLLTSAFGTIFSPSSSAILPSLLKKDELAAGNGLIQSGTTVAGFIGSPVGGALVILVGVGAGLVYNSVTFAISALLIGLMVIPVALSRESDGSQAARTSLLADVRSGLSFLRSQPALLAFTLVGMALNFFSFYLIYIVVYTSNLLHAGAGVFGLLVGIQSAGYAVGGLLIVGQLKVGRAPGVWIPVAWGLGGLPLLLMVALPFVPVAIVCVAGLGLLSALANITFISAVQRTVPDKFLGRYFALDTAGSYAMIPAGLAVGGVLIVAYGVGFGFLVAGAGMLVTGLGLLASGRTRAWARS